MMNEMLFTILISRILTSSASGDEKEYAMCSETNYYELSVTVNVIFD